MFCNRRQESMYTMTGLYSETGDDSSVDVQQDEISESSCNGEGMLDETQHPSTHICNICKNNQQHQHHHHSHHHHDATIIKCHSRQPSSGVVDRDKSKQQQQQQIDDYSRDCGILGCRPKIVQKFARIKVFY